MFSSSNNPNKILVVDDDARQITLLHKVLRTQGKIYFEQDGRKAFERVIEICPDVILLDIDMPGTNGYQVLDRLQHDDRTHQIPVIFITSFDSFEDQLRGLNSGAVDFIAKPLRPELVAARVKTHIQLRTHQRELAEISQHARITLDSTGDSVITTDIDGCITYMNPAAELITGVSFSEANGQEIESVMPLRIGERDFTHINPIRLAIKEKRTVGMALNCQLKQKNGNWISVEDSASPLLSESGEVKGAVIVFSDINESHAMALRMSYALQHDQLTNLPNRFLLLDRLKMEITQCQSSNNIIGLVLVDIDNFKYINEEYGFQFGDSLLQKIAKRIHNQLTNNETLSRHNADEFMLLVPNIQDPNELSSLAMRIQEEINQYAELHTELHNFSITMGVSIYPNDADNAQQLMLNADAAMHRAKKDRSYEGICFYSDSLESKFLSRNHVYVQLKNAIANNKVVALYQPIVRSDTHQIEAVEVLMRIEDQQGDILTPDKFIDIAEETRLIIPLGEQLIDIALKQLHQWKSAGFNLRICLNISPLQFLDPNFVPYLLKKIHDHSLLPSSVELEVTESLMLQSLDKVTRDMTHLRQLGITISIDDFGTGYSCLSYLKDLPVDVLKIDRSFIAQLEKKDSDELLVTTIANLANNMGLSSVAEGIETERQSKRLQELGVPFLQGYYFSPPVPHSEIEKKLLL
ncbi:hypothetical protein TW81_10875 [Vibrio galatheae]|uniref:Diguanylate cyclase n=1 Tax=Vibrio galatheae TaxID=579748 RepID=A0A0F4NL19_9VIBR|nr:EAL domain-containing protein [Vibrio galatheae]KJY82721.1 hypothetical protein TW81_10875 [Vibrio galatheae]